jgi:hypothetical protein
MSDTLDWNAKTIAEFRANQGRVGGPFEGAPLVLAHHRGRKSGREYVTPMLAWFIARDQPVPQEVDDHVAFLWPCPDYARVTRVPSGTPPGHAGTPGPASACAGAAPRAGDGVPG